MFILRLYGVRHMLKDNSDSERGNPCRHIGYFFRLAARFLNMHQHTDKIEHTTAFVTPVMEHWLHLRIYGVIYMVKDNSDMEIATLSDWQQRLFYMHHPTDKIAHVTAFVTPVVDHWPVQEIAQWVHHEGSI